MEKAEKYEYEREVLREEGQGLTPHSTLGVALACVTPPLPHDGVDPWEPRSQGRGDPCGPRESKRKSNGRKQIPTVFQGTLCATAIKSRQGSGPAGGYGGHTYTTLWWTCNQATSRFVHTLDAYPGTPMSWVGGACKEGLTRDALWSRLKIPPPATIGPGAPSVAPSLPSLDWMW